MGGRQKTDVSPDTARARRFEAVAAEVYEPLQRYLRRRAPADDAADVFGDTMLTVWRRLDDVPTDAALPWCYGVARRCLANHRRSASRRERLTEKVIAEGPDVADGDPQRQVERLDPALDAALGRLSDAEREIVHLWAWEQLEPRQIAVVLDTTSNAVSVALSRAKRKLASELDDVTHGGDDEDDGERGRQDRTGAGQEPDGDATGSGKETR